MELFTAVCKWFLYIFLVPWIKFQETIKNLMGISEGVIFLSFFMAWVVNFFKYLWNSASFFSLRKCKQTTVVRVERGKVVIISSNTAPVATCPRNSDFDFDSLSTIPEEIWSGVHCSSLFQSDVTTAWQQISLSEGRYTQILHHLIFVCVLKRMRWLMWKWALSYTLMC